MSAASMTFLLTSTLLKLCAATNKCGCSGVHDLDHLRTNGLRDVGERGHGVAIAQKTSIARGLVVENQRSVERTTARRRLPIFLLGLRNFVVLSKEAGRARERGHAAASGVLERPEAACGVLERACSTAALHHNSRRPAWQGALSLHRHLVARGWLARSRRQCIRGAAVSAQVHEGASPMGQRGAWQGGQALHHIAEERTTTRLGICSSP